HDGLYGAIRFYRACGDAGIKPIIGAEMTLEDGHHITLLAKDNGGYANLCRLITDAHLARKKGDPRLTLDGLARRAAGLVCLSGCHRGAVPDSSLSGNTDGAYRTAVTYRDIFGRDDFYIELQNNLSSEDMPLCHTLRGLAGRLDLGYVATNNVHYATREKHRLHDVLTCIRHHTTLEECTCLRPNSEFYLKGRAEMAGLFHEHPEALRATQEIAEKCNVALDFSAYRFPDFPLPAGETPDSYLAKLCRRRANERYGTITTEVDRRLGYELRLIQKLGLSGYFLIVGDIMDYARKNSIPAQGRGSAANSIVAYILGITKVDPIANKLFLGRFLSEEMASVPDIDIDVSTSHREKLIQYVYQKYGPEHTAMVCTYVTFQARNAVREVGKVLGMPAHILDRMAKSVSCYEAADLKQDLSGLGEFQTYFRSVPWQEFASLCRDIAGFPRHLSIHNGGMLISSCPLTDMVPLERARMPGRVVCQWDKDGVADAGLIKVDLLGLRMLSLIEEARRMVEHRQGAPLDMDALPLTNGRVYDMICSGDTMGVFQVESRAQMQTLPRTRPRSIEDLTTEVALVRPGPLQGNMVHPYIRRRRGLEEVTYLHPTLKPILEDTLGVLLFQEQVIQVATTAAGFTPGEADSLRRLMSRKGAPHAVSEMKQRFMEGAGRNGIDVETATRIFATIEGFARYGFCKSHAAGFALLCYQSAWLKCYHPAEFYCALLNNQPMGFYTPEVIVRDAGRHGVEVLPVDINRSDCRCIVEEGRVRLGLMYVKNLREKAMKRITAGREKGPYRSLEDFYARAGLEKGAVDNLVLAGAFASLHSSRRTLLWQLRVLEKGQPSGLPLRFRDTQVALPPLTSVEEMEMDYSVQGLSTTHHPVHVVGGLVSREGMHTSAQLARARPDARVRVAGYVIIRQRPVTAKGFVFLTLEDEYGTMNVVVKPPVYERYRQVVRLEPLLVVEGRVQKRDSTLNIVADRVHPLHPRRLSS
ncbi:MAG: DNA polymerase III subunit alpha, partial [Chloroflexota bacterium]